MIKLKWQLTTQGTFSPVFIPAGSYLGKRNGETVAIILDMEAVRNQRFEPLVQFKFIVIEVEHRFHYAHKVSGKWEVFGQYHTLQEAQDRAQADEPVLVA